MGRRENPDTPQANDGHQMQPSAKDYHYRRLLFLSASDVFLIGDGHYSQSSEGYSHHRRFPGTGSDGATH